ncbi:hypothetical protein NDU88_007000 [Pleurodeles waltl]|uniref:Uncharacterized protein n=1 Tax=Pleurodeles waltl TaxID=8319 RepID=A0AAV7PL92_PLEWA|nr:hypothetical protein NDU88_007000 [Pleurodeles waltl]
MPPQVGPSHMQISLDPVPHGNSPARTAKPGPHWTRNKHPGTGFGVTAVISQASLNPVVWEARDPRLGIPLPLRATKQKQQQVMDGMLNIVKHSPPVTDLHLIRRSFAHGNSPARTAKPGSHWTGNKHPGTGFGVSPLISQGGLNPVAWEARDPRLGIPFPLRATKQKQQQVMDGSEFLLLTMPPQFGPSHMQISLETVPHGNSPARTAKPGPHWTGNKHPGTGFGVSPLISQASLNPVAWEAQDPRLGIPFPLRATKQKQQEVMDGMLNIVKHSPPVTDLGLIHRSFAHHATPVRTQPYANQS